MNIIFKSVKAHNFFSFEDLELTFNNVGYTIVSGVNNCSADNTVSNGSGKSTLFESIVWCLTGETVRGTKEIKRLGAKDSCYVELEFNVDGNEFKVVRSKDPANLKLFVNGEDVSGKGIRDTEKLLVNYLPDLTSDLLGSIIILGQGLPKRFTNNTPSGRKEVLEKLSKSDFMIEDLKNRIANTTKLYNDSVKEKENTILSLTGEIKALTGSSNRYREALSNLVKPDAANAARLQDKITEMKDKISEEQVIVDNKLQEYKDAEQAVNKFDLNKIQKKLDLEKTFSEGINQSKLDLTTLNTDIQNKKREFVKLASIKDTCPTCGQKIQGVVKPDTTSLKNEITKLEEQVKVKTEEQTKLIAERDEASRKLQATFTDESLRLISTRDFAKQTHLTESKLLEQYKNNLILLDREYTKLEEQNKSYDTQKKQFEDLLAEAESSITIKGDELKTVEDNKDQVKLRLDVAKKFDTIIKRDFRGYLLSNVIDFINTSAKSYSQDIFGTDKIEFKLDGNNISISYNGKEYEMLSGGEKQKVDIIIQFSIRDMLCKFLGFSSNILVLDEIFDNLDSTGCEKVLYVISKRLSDVQNVYIVTHHGDIQIPYDNELIVYKNELGVSSLKEN